MAMVVEKQPDTAWELFNNAIMDAVQPLFEQPPKPPADFPEMVEKRHNLLKKRGVLRQRLEQRNNDNDDF